MERHAGEAEQPAREAGRRRGRANERELADERGALNHAYDMTETGGWNDMCEGHRLGHAGALHVTKSPGVAQDKGDN